MRSAPLFLLLLAFVSVGCDAPPKKTPVEDENGVAAIAKDFREHIETSQFILAKTDFDKLSKDPARVKEFAPLVSDAVLKNWPKVEANERPDAKTIGAQRARGGSTSCYTCKVIHPALDALSAEVPAIGEKWKALHEELDKIEADAYAAEKADTRTIVAVRASSNEAALVADCVTKALEKNFPTYRWLLQSAAPGKPALEILTKSDTARYRSANGKQNTALFSGLDVTLEGRDLDATLAPVFETPIHSASNVDTPERIGDPLVGADIAAIQIGMKKIEELSKVVCADLEKKIDASRAAAEKKEKKEKKKK